MRIFISEGCKNGKSAYAQRIANVVLEVVCTRIIAHKGEDIFRPVFHEIH